MKYKKSEVIKFLGENLEIDFTRKKLKEKGFKSVHGWTGLKTVRVLVIDLIKQKADVKEIETGNTITLPIRLLESFYKEN